MALVDAGLPGAGHGVARNALPGCRPIVKPLTKTVASRGGGIAAQFAPAEPKSKKAAVANTAVANSNSVANKPRYIRWREANPDLYLARQRDYMRKKRAKEHKK